jgi:LmbE family N-acetylglucosaminyl deacetylase
MAPEAATLLVVAHPDDEALWFTSVLTRHAPVDLVVVTGGGDGEVERRRQGELERSSALYGIATTTQLAHKDVFGRGLDVAALRSDLAPLAGRGYAEVFTHGPLGETFVHPHHQDISLVVHELFQGVWSTSWNQLPELVVTLSPEEYRLKQEAIGAIYWQEYSHLLPAYEVSAVEKFARLPLEAVERLYWSLTAGMRSDDSARAAQRHLRRAAPDSDYETERRTQTLALIEQAGGAPPVALCDWRLRAAPPAGELAALRACGFDTIAPADLGAAAGPLVLGGLRDAREVYDAFTALRASHVVTDVEPSQPLIRAIAQSAGAAGYTSSAETLVAPRFEWLSDGAAAVYQPGAQLTLWHRAGGRPLAFSARRRLRSRGGGLARRLKRRLAGQRA